MLGLRRNMSQQVEMAFGDREMLATFGKLSFGRFQLSGSSLSAECEEPHGKASACAAASSLRVWATRFQMRAERILARGARTLRR